MKHKTALAVLSFLLLAPVFATVSAHGGPGMGMMMDRDRYQDRYHDRMMQGQGMMGGMGMMNGMGMMGGMYGMGMMGGMGPMMMLDLDDKQRQEMRQIQRKVQEKNWERMGEMMELRNQMQDLMLSDNPDPTATGKIYDKMANLRKQMFMERLQARNTMMNKLTEEQREQLQNYRRQYGGYGMMPDMME